MKKAIILIGWTILLVSSCIDPIQLPIRNGPPLLVVEGAITTASPPYTVRLSLTGPPDQPGNPNPLITRAVVVLSDGLGQSTSFRADASKPGYYYSVDSTFRGQPDQSYSINITLPDGRQYTSMPEKLPAAPPIDSMTRQLTQTTSPAQPYAFSFGIVTTDPGSQKNYYSWTARAYGIRHSVGVPCSLGSPSLCNQDCWIPTRTNKLNVLDDRSINGNRIYRQIINLPIFYVGPQYVEVHQYSLTREAYQFDQSFLAQQARTGSIFDPLPSPLLGNIVNIRDPHDQARGYFRAMGESVKQMRFEWPANTIKPAVVSFIASLLIPPGDCTQAYSTLEPYLVVLPPPGFK